MNPSFLIPVLLAPLSVLVTTPASRIEILFRSAPAFAYMCCLVVVILLWHASWMSISTDTSFIPTMILICLPLWAMTSALLFDPKRLFFCFSLLVAVIAFYSAAEFLISNQRAHAPLLDPGNFVTMIGLVMIPTTLTLANSDVRYKNFLVGSACAIFALAMLATHTRFSMLALVGLSMLVIGVRFSLQISWQTIISVLVGIGIGFAVYLIVDQGAIASTFDGTATSSEAPAPRSMLWQAAWQGIREVGGLNGAGLYAFTLIYPLYRSPFEDGTIGILVHNDLLQLLLEGGIWFVIPMLVLIVCITWKLGKGIFTRTNSAVKLGSAAALMFAILHSMVNFVFYSLPLVLLCGVLLAICYAPDLPRKIDVKNTLDKNYGIRWGYAFGKWVMVAVLSVNIFYLSIDVLSLGVFSSHRHVPGTSLFNKSLDKMLSYSRMAQNLNSNRSLPIYAEVKVLEALYQQNPTPFGAAQIHHGYDKALSTDLWNPSVYTSYLGFLQSTSNSDASVKSQQRLLEQAIELNPYSVETNMVALSWYSLNDRKQKIIESVERVVLWCRTLSPPTAAKELLRVSVRHAEEIGKTGLLERAHACQVSVSKPRHHGRKKTMVMRWLTESENLN